MASANVRLLGRPGALRHVLVPAPDAPLAGAGAATASEGVIGPRWWWEGAFDGPGLAAVVRAAATGGSVPCEVDGRPHRLGVVACWYDAGCGLAVVELTGPPEPLA